MPFDPRTGRYTSAEEAAAMGVPYYQEGGEQVYTGSTPQEPVGFSGGFGGQGSIITAAAAAGSVLAPLAVGYAAGEMDITDLLSIGAPGGEYDISAIAPGGAPFRFPDLPGGLRMAKHWWTGTTMFAIDELDGRWVAKKLRRRFMPDTWIWHKYRLRKPIVIGKAATPKNRRKIVRALKRFNKTAKPIYGPSRRRGSVRRR